MYLSSPQSVELKLPLNSPHRYFVYHPAYCCAERTCSRDCVYRRNLKTLVGGSPDLSAISTTTPTQFYTLAVQWWPGDGRAAKHVSGHCTWLLPDTADHAPISLYTHWKDRHCVRQWPPMLYGWRAACATVSSALISIGLFFLTRMPSKPQGCRQRAHSWVFFNQKKAIIARPER